MALLAFIHDLTRDLMSDHDPQPQTETTAEYHDGGPAITHDPGRSLHPVRLTLWALGPLVALGGIIAPHLFSVGVLLLIVQATNRWGLRRVRPSVKFVFVTCLVTAALITTQPAIGDRLAATITGAFRGLTGNS